LLGAPLGGIFWRHWRQQKTPIVSIRYGVEFASVGPEARRQDLGGTNGPNAIFDFRRGVEGLAVGRPRGSILSFEVTGGPILCGSDDPDLADLSPYPGTEKWEKAIGSHVIWVIGHVTVSRTLRWKRVTARSSSKVAGSADTTLGCGAGPEARVLFARTTDSPFCAPRRKRVPCRVLLSAWQLGPPFSERMAFRPRRRLTCPIHNQR
jgi:hypothetical protein